MFESLLTFLQLRIIRSPPASANQSAPLLPRNGFSLTCSSTAQPISACHCTNVSTLSAVVSISPIYSLDDILRLKIGEFKKIKRQRKTALMKFPLTALMLLGACRADEGNYFYPAKKYPFFAKSSRKCKLTCVYREKERKRCWNRDWY